jgi:hypothetical protein
MYPKVEEPDFGKTRRMMVISLGREQQSNEGVGEAFPYTDRRVEEKWGNELSPPSGWQKKPKTMHPQVGKQGAEEQVQQRLPACSPQREERGWDRPTNAHERVEEKGPRRWSPYFFLSLI